jgi:hypothetical protein
MFRMLITLGFFAAVTIVIVNIVYVIGRVRTRSIGAPNTAALEERVARLEHVIEGLTAENQRLVDGQRFFTQLLAERPVPSIAARAGSNQDGARTAR